MLLKIDFILSLVMAMHDQILITNVSDKVLRFPPKLWLDVKDFKSFEKKKYYIN